MMVFETMLGDRTRARLARIREYLYGSTTGKLVHFLVPAVIYVTCAAWAGRILFGCRFLTSPVVTAFNASPVTIAPGSSATLTWATAYLASCTAGNNWNGTYAAGANVGLSGMTAVMPSVTSTYTIVCQPLYTNESSVTAKVTVTVMAVPPSPGVFVIDATNTLFSFDSSGNLVNQVTLTGAIGNLNGGGIAVAQGNVYVTLGQPTNSVLAFNATTLAPVALPAGAFSGLSVPRGIAFDTNNSQFYVANGGASINVYDSSGKPVSVAGNFPQNYGPSGISFDPNDKTLWVANFVGAVNSPPTFGVAEYNEDGTAHQNFNYSTQFITPETAELEPYAIAYCAGAGAAASPVIVGFIPFSLVMASQIGSHKTTGTVVAGPFGGTTANPHGLSCSLEGQVFVAADNGLLEYNFSGGLPIGPTAGTFTGLTAPIYGVFANY